MGAGDENGGRHFLHHAFDRQLMGGINEAPQERDGDGRDVLVQQGLDRRTRLIDIERQKNLTLPIDTFAENCNSVRLA